MEKKIYNAPAIEKVNLDNEISLALSSLPVKGPGETFLDINSTSPFKKVDGLV